MCLLTPYSQFINDGLGQGKPTLASLTDVLTNHITKTVTVFINDLLVCINVVKRPKIIVEHNFILIMTLCYC